MRQRIDEISHRQHFPRSRLPTFTDEEVEYIKGSADFLGLNHYTTYLASKGTARPNMQPTFDTDMGVSLSQKIEWPKSNSTWLKVRSTFKRTYLYSKISTNKKTFPKITKNTM